MTTKQSPIIWDSLRTEESLYNVLRIPIIREIVQVAAGLFPFLHGSKIVNGTSL